MNTFGHIFRITSFGESHGGAVGVVIDGCPAGLKLSVKDFEKDLERRRTAQSSIVSPRKEADEVEILSGVFKGKTIGSPICLMVRNKNARPEDYEKLKNTYRPSHADFTYEAKYGIRNWQGGGRASARETVARVMAGVVAKKILRNGTPLSRLGGRGTSPLKRGELSSPSVEILAYVRQVGEIVADIDPEKVTLKKVESNIVRCPDQKAAKKMIALIKEVQKAGDTIGGVVECVVRNVPVGLGDPIFDKLKATLAHAVMSLPATMGVEFGSGFGSLGMLGSEHNDEFIVEGPSDLTSSHKKGSPSLLKRREVRSPSIKTKTNHSGGVQGGISNGMPIIFRTVFKPVSTIFQPQQTVTKQGKKHTLQMHGRHDPCVVPRAVVMVEAMTAIVLVDHWLRQRSVRV